MPANPHAALPDWDEIEPLREFDNPSREQFWSDIHASGQPAILRGHCADWPAVGMADRPNREFAEHLINAGPNPMVRAIIGSGDMGGRFFYDESLRGFNFDRAEARFSVFLSKLMQIERGEDDAHAYVAATPIDTLAPRFGAQNASDFAPAGTPALAWIGNASRIAPHFDSSDNVACVVRGPRTFLLFPPERVSDLYVGPIDHNMAGQPASLVDPRDPDLERFPRYADAMPDARIAHLQPGDAIFIPALHWHYVESRSPLSMLVNYWWSEADAGHGLSSLAYAVMALRELSPNQRAAWRSLFDHYVFGEGAERSTAHIPEEIRGILGRPSPERDHRIKSFLAQLLR